jgi:hypothetical protein
VPAEYGEPLTGINTPLNGSIEKAETLLEPLFAA